MWPRRVRTEPRDKPIDGGGSGLRSWQRSDVTRSLWKCYSGNPEQSRFHTGGSVEEWGATCAKD